VLGGLVHWAILRETVKLSRADMTSVKDGKREILFISALPASHSNAIGVLTLRFAGPFGDAWKHCYWDTNMGKSEVSNSIFLNSEIPRLWPSAAGRGFAARFVERFELGWWHGDKLLASRKPQLEKMFQDTGFAYAAPLRNSEATRCREILEVVQCPFVVHLWDIMDRSLNDDYAWLFSHAEHVFCLSEPMIAFVKETAQCETGLLSFVRPRSKVRASFSKKNSIAIGLIGFLAAYRDGLELVAQATESLQANFSRVTVRYIGPPSQLAYIPESLRRLTEHVGFLVGDELDQALLDCDCGLLPGPLLAPEQDPRSRYSVPSRVADYLAVGLPVIATVHPNSATSTFCSPLRSHGFFPVTDGAGIVGALKTLREERVWLNASGHCESFFNQRCDANVALEEFYSIANKFLLRGVS
jgi:hypothetical protein